MKRLMVILACIMALSLSVPGLVFGGGKSDKGSSNKSGSGANPSQPSASGTPAVTNIQDSEQVAEIQISPDIKKEFIIRGQLKSMLEQIEKASPRPLTATEKRYVLETMINEKLAIQAADRDKVTVSENEVNQQIQGIRGQMVQVLGRLPSDDEFNQYLSAQGYTEDSFKIQIRNQLIVQKYLLTKKEGLFKSITPPTDQEIRDFFNLEGSKLVRPATVRISAIQIPFGSDKIKAKTLAEALVRDIKSDPAKFDELVSRGRSNRNLGYQAGDAGFVPKGAEAQQALGKEFVDVVFNGSLKQGSVSKLIEAPQSFQIIKITEQYDEKKTLTLDDEIQVGSGVTVRAYISDGLLQQKQQQIFAQATEELARELQNNGQSYKIFDKNLPW